MFINIIFLFFSLIFAAAYLSLFERKLIGRIQLRYGPSYCGIFGILQPIADVLKLLCKRNAINNHSIFAIISICVIVCCEFLISCFLPFCNGIPVLSCKFGLFYIAILYIIISIAEIIIGLSGNSKFGVIGSIRIYFQKLAYYFPLLLIFMIIGNYTNDFNIVNIITTQKNTLFLFSMPHIFIIFCITMLIIINRIPFDFAEAESELVAGNYTEYGGILFGLIYLADYINLINAAALIVTLFFGVNGMLSFITKMFIIISIIITIRAILPRYKQYNIIKMFFGIITPILLIHYILFCK